MLTLDGEAGDVQTAATVVDELVELIEQGHEIAPGTIEAVTGALDANESPAAILEDVVWRHRNTKVAPKTLNQKRYVDSIRRHTITFGIGPAGTGKTFLAVAMAAAALAEREVQRVILTRPAVEAGERLGFLPGDIQAKVDPYLRPLFDALYDMLDPDRVNGYFDRGVIEVAPLAFMRGRTFNDSFVILDEAQNTSPEQMKMFLTRLGFNSRMVVTGDITQIDLPRDQRSGLIAVREILHQVQDISFVHFGGEDVVRHKLVQRIVAAYGEHAERESAGLTLDLADVPAELRDAVGAALFAGGVEEGHVAVELVEPERMKELNGRYRGVAEPTDVLAFPVDGAGTAPGPRELGDVDHLPAAHPRPARGGGPRGAAPLRLRPRDRRRRDAGAAGSRFVASLGRGRDAFGLRRPGRAAQRRQVDAAERARRLPRRDHLPAAADDSPRRPRSR